MSVARSFTLAVVVRTLSWSSNPVNWLYSRTFDSSGPRTLLYRKWLSSTEILTPTLRRLNQWRKQSTNSCRLKYWRAHHPSKIDWEKNSILREQTFWGEWKQQRCTDISRTTAKIHAVQVKYADICCCCLGFLWRRGNSDHSAPNNGNLQDAMGLH